VAFRISRRDVLPGSGRYALQRQRLSGIIDAAVWYSGNNTYSVELGWFLLNLKKNIYYAGVLIFYFI
jgi:hypothetical protein